MNLLRLVLCLSFLASLGRAQTLSPVQVDALRQKIRTNFFVPDPLPALQGVVHRRFDPAPGVTAEALSYATESGMEVPAILYLPKNLPPGGKIPGFVVINGHGGDKYSWYSYYTGILFARGGAAVLTYDQIGEGERNRLRKSGTRAHDYLKGGPDLPRRLCGLMLTDAMQAVSYLASRPEVDSSRIAAGGYSLGSFILAIDGAVDPRLKACVLAGGGNLDGPGGIWDSDKPVCEGTPYRSLGFLGDRPAVLYALNAARGDTLIWNGRADTVVHMPETLEPFFDGLRSRTEALLANDRGVFSFGFTPEAGHRPYFITRSAVLWLHQRLHFPFWTDEAIEGMPETHISEWAQRYAIPMDKGYSTELREGGVRALGDQIPGYTRDELSVLNGEDWAAQKSRFIIDTWAAGVGGTLPEKGK